MKQVDIKLLIFSILIPIVLGFIIGMLVDVQYYQSLQLPWFAPPSWVFPIVWSFLYVLMGISFYIVLQSKNPNIESSIMIYIIQLFVNLSWSIIFFVLKWDVFSFVWIIILLILVLLMIVQFYKINKIAGLLQFPYLIWLVFAGVLNLVIIFLN